MKPHRITCSQPECGTLLGLERENGLHVKYKNLELVSEGRTSIFCRKCGAITDWLPKPERGRLSHR